jgi:hypothetical protein
VRACCHTLLTDPGATGRYSLTIDKQMSHAAMVNAFSLLTFLGSGGVVISFLSGSRAMARYGQVSTIGKTITAAWRVVFYLAVFTTLLAAPFAG